MAARFHVRATTKFSAAHVLHGYPGACDRVHGHNFEVDIEVERGEVDDIGMALDFVQLRRMADEISAGLDHRLLNDVPAFADKNPTAEHIAQHYFHALKQPVAALGAVMVAVTVRETDFSAVRYSEA